MAYTNIDDPSAFFQTFLYTGNQSGRQITLDGNSDLQPDLYWYKARNANHHYWVDSSRGKTKYIYSSLTSAEATVASAYVTSFNTNGFGVGGGDSGTNANGISFGNWAWKANGGTTTSFSESQSNAGGTYQKNETAGFSIVSYTGIDTAGEVTHGLTTQPQVVIVKNRTAAANWATYHESAGIIGTLFLNTTAAKGDTTAYFHTGWGAATKFPIGTNAATNTDGNDYVAYVFSERQGYSKFGSYVGNGNANGTFVYTGFKPAFLLWKITNTTGDWRLVDNKRGVNGAIPRIKPNANSAEGSAGDNVDLLSNGFKFRSTAASANAANASYIYMAFAENPFVTSTGIPTTAR